MSLALSYPGVYVEEIPSGVRTITGVPTSVTAFLGRAPLGEVDEPVVLTSWSDFERQYGGLSVDYPLSYAVRDFYLNGGSLAVIVRLYNPPTVGDPPVAGSGVAALTLLKTVPAGSGDPPPLGSGDLALQAISPGAWGNALTAWVDYDGIDGEDDIAAIAASFGVKAEDLFNLNIKLGADGPTERFLNVSMADGTRRVDRVLSQDSGLMVVASKPAMTQSGRPAQADPISATGGDDGKKLDWTHALGTDSGGVKTGMYALDRTEDVNLLCIPPDVRSNLSADDVPVSVYTEALTYCVRRRAMLLVDPPSAWDSSSQTLPSPTPKVGDVGLFGVNARNAAVFYPRLLEADPLRRNILSEFVPCGAVAGIFSATDSTRGVWKAPAGLDASLQGVQGLSVSLNDLENGLLNPQGINCIRVMPGAGPVIWGARTLRGADRLADEYRYIPVRRTALFIEESLYRGTQWVVFEPNDEPLWSQIRLNVGSFMHSLFRQGAFQGSKASDAYLVKCDRETTTQDDINSGVVNILVGFAPLKPAEFVVIQLQQLAGQIAT